MYLIDDQMKDIKAIQREDISLFPGDLPHPTTGAPIPALLTWLQKN